MWAFLEEYTKERLLSQVLKDHSEVSLEPSLLQAKQAQFTQYFFEGEVLQLSDHHLPLPASNPSFNDAQDTAGLWGGKHTLLPHE